MPRYSCVCLHQMPRCPGNVAIYLKRSGVHWNEREQLQQEPAKGHIPRPHACFARTGRTRSWGSVINVKAAWRIWRQCIRDRARRRARPMSVEATFRAGHSCPSQVQLQRQARKQPVVHHYAVVDYQQQLHPRPCQLQREQHLIVASSIRASMMQCHASIRWGRDLP